MQEEIEEVGTRTVEDQESRGLRKKKDGRQKPNLGLGKVLSPAPEGELSDFEPAGEREREHEEPDEDTPSTTRRQRRADTGRAGQTTT
jgi:hypothetical protein